MKFPIHVTFVYETVPEPQRLRELKLCCLLASRHYQPIVHTNLDLSSLKLHAEIQPVEWRREQVWSVHKLRTFAVASDLPYIHIDSDVFLENPLPLPLVMSRLFVQNPEPIAHYNKIVFMPEVWRDKYATGLGEWRAYCMGVFGGDAEIVRQYAQFALRAAAEACKPCKPTFVEQAPLGRFCIDRGIAPALLKEWTYSPFPPGIHHLMRAKDHPSSLALVEKLARRWGLDAD